jgi:hypothetical protein
MDEFERMAEAAGEGMADTYGKRVPRINESVWYWREPGNPKAGRAIGTVDETLGLATPDPILVLRHTAEGHKVIRVSHLAPAWEQGQEPPK